MLSTDGHTFRIEIPLSRYTECRKLLEQLDLLEVNYAAAANDAARIVVIKQLLDTYHSLIELLLLDRN